MPWRGVTTNEERQLFLQEYRLGYYSVSDLADCFSISRQTAPKWIRRLEHYGQTGFHDLPRRPPAASSSVKVSPAPGAASVALTQAVPSPLPRAPTTSGPPITRVSSASETAPTASPSPSAISPPASSSASTPTRPSPLSSPRCTSPGSSKSS